MAERRNLNTNEIAREKTKLLLKIRTKHQILPKGLAGVEYELQQQDKDLQSFTLRLVDVILSC